MRDFTFYRRRGYVDIHLAFQAPAAQWTFTGFSSTDPRLPSHLHREETSALTSALLTVPHSITLSPHRSSRSAAKVALRCNSCTSNLRFGDTV